MVCTCKRTMESIACSSTVKSQTGLVDQGVIDWWKGASIVVHCLGLCANVPRLQCAPLAVVTMTCHNFCFILIDDMHLLHCMLCYNRHQCICSCMFSLTLLLVHEVYTSLLLLASPSTTLFPLTSSPAINSRRLCVYNHLASFVRSCFLHWWRPRIGSKRLYSLTTTSVLWFRLVEFPYRS